jgi:hypothetical protein
MSLEDNTSSEISKHRKTLPHELTHRWSLGKLFSWELRVEWWFPEDGRMEGSGEERFANVYNITVK